MKMRYKLRSSLGAGASPGEKKKSTKKKPKCKAKKGVPTKKEGDESKRQNPNFEIAEETIRDSSTLEELEIKEGSRRIGNELPTSSIKKQKNFIENLPINAKTLSTSKISVNKRVNVQRKHPISPTVDNFLKTNSISYLGAVSFSGRLNSIDGDNNQEAAGDMENKQNNKEQTFALMLVFNKSEMPCLLNIESSLSGCVVSKKVSEEYQDSEDDGTSSDDCSLEPSKFYGTAVKPSSSSRRKHCCIFCGDCSSNLFGHWKTQHTDEYLVNEILKLDNVKTDGSIKEKKYLMTRLKSEGDYNNNKIVLQNPLWVRKVSSDKSENNVSISKADVLIKCKVCKIIFCRNNLSDHLKTCVVRPNKTHVGRNTSSLLSNSTKCGCQSEQISKIVKENVINPQAALNSVNTSNPTGNDNTTLRLDDEEGNIREMETSRNPSDIFPWAKRITGKHYCVYCKHLVYQFRNHMLKTHKRERKIAHYNRLLKVSRADTVPERNKIIEDLCDEGDRIYLEIIEKDPFMIGPLSSRLDETLPPQKRKYSDQYEMCRNCKNYFSEEELIEHVCEGGYSSEQGENHSFDWINKLSVSDCNYKVQISKDLHLMNVPDESYGGIYQDVSSNSFPQTATTTNNDNYEPKSILKHNNILDCKKTFYNGGCSNQITTQNKEISLESHTLLNKADSSEPSNTLNEGISSKQNTSLNKVTGSTLSTTLNKEIGIKPSTSLNKAHDSEQKTSLNKGSDSKLNTSLNKVTGSTLSTTLHKETSLKPSTTLNKVKDSTLRTTLNKETSSEQGKEDGSAQKTSFYHYDSSDSDDYMFRRRKSRPWTQEEKSLVIKEFKHFIIRGSNPGTTRCKELIAKHEILSGRNEMQVNTMIDNINRGKLKLPSEFKHLQVYQSMY